MGAEYFYEDSALDTVLWRFHLPPSHRGTKGSLNVDHYLGFEAFYLQLGSELRIFSPKLFLKISLFLLLSCPPPTNSLFSRSEKSFRRHMDVGQLIRERPCFSEFKYLSIQIIWMRRSRPRILGVFSVLLPNNQLWLWILAKLPGVKKNFTFHNWQLHLKGINN